MFYGTETDKNLNFMYNMITLFSKSTGKWNIIKNAYKNGNFVFKKSINAAYSY